MRNRNKPHEPYDPEVLARLREFYRPYNEELADYLDMDLDWDDRPGPEGPGPCVADDPACSGRCDAPGPRHRPGSAPRGRVPPSRDHRHRHGRASARARMPDSRRRAIRRTLLVSLVAATLLAGDLLAPRQRGTRCLARRDCRAGARSAEAAQTGGRAWPAGASCPSRTATFISTPFDVVTREGKPAWILGGANTGVLALRWNGSAWLRSAATTRRPPRPRRRGARSATTGVLGVGYYRPLVGEGDGALEPISGRDQRLDLARPSACPTRPAHGPRWPTSRPCPTGRAWAVGTRLEAGRLRRLRRSAGRARWLAREDPTIGAERAA